MVHQKHENRKKPEVPDVTIMSDEDLLELYASTYSYDEWVVSNSEIDNAQAVLDAAKPEILKRMGRK